MLMPPSFLPGQQVRAAEAAIYYVGRRVDPNPIDSVSINIPMYSTSTVNDENPSRFIDMLLMAVWGGVR